jgi:hypothetical protein
MRASGARRTMSDGVPDTIGESFFGSFFQKRTESASFYKKKQKLSFSAR